MSVMIDHESLAAEALGLETVGQVLAHVQRDRRLVINLLIDGEQPNFSMMGQLRKSLVQGRTLFIETVLPADMARDVLHEVEDQLKEAENFRNEAADLLQLNQVAKAMEKLGLCFTTWQTAQESIQKVGQLLHLDLNALSVEREPLTAVLAEFSDQLRQIKEALQVRDFVCLSDLLLYDMAATHARWAAVLGALREFILN